MLGVLSRDMRSAGKWNIFVLIAVAALAFAAPASAKEKTLKPAKYAGMTTYSCRSDAIPIHPGQNLNLFGLTKTCPNAQVVSGPGDTSVFNGSPAVADSRLFLRSDRALYCIGKKR